MDEIFEKAKEKKVKYRGPIYAMTFGFVITCFITIFLDTLFGYMAIILFPFLVLPYFIAMQMTIMQLDNLPFNRKTFNSAMRLGFFPNCRIPFRTLANVLLALLIYALVSSLTLGILYLTPSYNDYISQLILVIQNSDAQNIYSNISAFANSNIETYNFVMYLTTTIGYGAGFMFFVYKMLHNALYALCRVSASLPNGKDKPIFKDVFPHYKKQYYKIIFSKEWYKIILIPLLFAGGVVLCYFTNLLNFAIPVSCALSVVGIAILLPDLLLIQENTYAVMFDELSASNFTNMNKIYKQMRSSDNLTEEQKQELDNFINHLKDVIDGEKNNNENKDKDDKDDNNKNE